MGASHSQFTEEELKEYQVSEFCPLCGLCVEYLYAFESLKPLELFVGFKRAYEKSASEFINLLFKFDSTSKYS